MKITCDNCGCVMVGDKSIESEHRSAALDVALNMGDSPNLSAPMRCPVCSEPPHKIYYACALCGSTSVMVQEWVNPNTEEVTPIPEITRLNKVEYDTGDWLEDGGDADAIDGHEILNEMGVCIEGLLDYDPKKARATQGVGKPSPYCRYRYDHGDFGEDGESEIGVPIFAVSRDMLEVHQADCWKKYNNLEAIEEEEL